MPKYTVILYSSGRVWAGQNVWLRNPTDALLVEDVEALTEQAALGKVLLKYVDAANQPHQHICPPCELPHEA